MRKTIIIIGAGLAGLSAAITASELGCSVKLVSSMPSERSQSVMAEGGINAALDIVGENDSPDEHFEDTMKAACGLADTNAVWALTHNAPDIVRWLYDSGVQFNTDGQDTPALRNFGGQKKKRTAYAKSDTGKQIMTALTDMVRKFEVNGSIERYSHHDFVTLITDENICGGCIIRDNYYGNVVTLKADGVIIASGGLHGLFGETTGAVTNTGLVTAELFRLGVKLADLEFIQYHPTTVKANGKLMLISEAARGEGGRLYSVYEGRKHYFMEEKYPELGNLMPRDTTSREIWNESLSGDVFLDMTGLSESIIQDKLSGTAESCKTYLNIDIRRTPVRVQPGIHYFMGGIYVDEHHRTSMKGLYAAGECCCQYHGANRLGGNSLLGAIYGGKTAAQTALSDDIKILPERYDIPHKATIPTALQEIMQRTMGVVRNEHLLKTGLSQLKELEDPSVTALAKAIILSAEHRKESRGAHYRDDHPETDKAFEKITIAQYSDGDIIISMKDVPNRR